jgi:hypothetical protein
VTAGGQWRKGRERERKGKLEPIRNLKNPLETRKINSKLEKPTRNSKNQLETRKNHSKLEKSTRNSKNPLETRNSKKKLETRKNHSKLEKSTRNSKKPLETRKKINSKLEKPTRNIYAHCMASPLARICCGRGTKLHENNLTATHRYMTK